MHALSTRRPASRPRRRRADTALASLAPASPHRHALCVLALLALAGCSDGGSDGPALALGGPDAGAGGTGAEGDRDAPGDEAPGDDGANDGSPSAGGAGRLVRAGVDYPLSDALLVDYGPTGAHYNIDISLADSAYRIASIPQVDPLFGGLTFFTIYPADDATVEFDAALYSPGTDGFRDGVFEFADVEESELEDVPPSLVGRAVFVEAALYPDADGDGESDEDGIGVAAGRLEIETTATGFSLALDVTLVDGTRVTGRYAGEALRADQTD